jgi:hypothetical protein
MIILLQPAMFSKLSKVVLLDEETQSINKTFEYTIKDLSVQVPLLCKQNKVNKVIIAGNKKFNQKIGQQIKSNAIAQYSLDIKIEYA